MSGGALTAGAVIGDTYCLVRLLGEGGMGYVWEATHVVSGAPFALKVLKGRKDEDRRRFQRELRAAAALRHRNVIAVHELVEAPDETLVIVMELLKGETLGAVLRREKRILLRDLAPVITQVLGALGAAHAIGIVHRDLKPDNIFLCASPTPEDELVVKVLDFGVAKLTAHEGLAAQTQALTGTGSMVGTPYYMSPEQVFGDKDLDARADIWSLGIVLYECLTGVRPTEADTVGRVLQRIMVADFAPITAFCPALPDDVVSLIGRMLSLEREGRHDDTDGIAAVLARHGSARASARALAITRALSTPASTVDPTAATVARTAPAPPMPPRKTESGGRTNTSDAVAVNAGRPSMMTRTKTRVVAGAGLATIALIGGTISLRISAESAVESNRSVVPSGRFASMDPPAVASKLATTGAAATPEPAQQSALTAPDAEPDAARPITAPQPPPPRPAVVAPAAAAVATTAASTKTAVAVTDAGGAPVCEAREVATNGHCCPRGHVWIFGRCERPFATTF